MIRAVGAALGPHAGRIGVGLLWLAAGLSALAPPPATRRGADPPPLRRVVEPVAHGVGRALAVAPNGDVWWITASRAVRFEAGEPTLGRVALDLGPPRARWRRAPGPIAAAHVDAHGALWLGTRHGEVAICRDGACRGLAGAFRGAGRPIAAIATHGERVYVAGAGLWRGTRSGPFEEIPAFAGTTLERAVAHPEHGVAVAAHGVVWWGGDAGWRRAWEARAADGAVSALALSPEGELWIGTEGGLVRVERSGGVHRELRGAPVAALFAGAGGAAYAGTRGAGLFARHASGWRRVEAAGGLGTANVTGLAAAPEGALWLALNDGGLFRAGPASRPPPVSASAPAGPGRSEGRGQP